MFLPLWEDSSGQLLEVEDESEQHVHFYLVLAQNDLLELVVGELIHSETNEIREEREKGAIVFAVGTPWEAGEDGVVGDLEEPSVAFAAIEYLFHEDSFGIFAFDLGQKLFCVRVGCHFGFIEGVDEFYTFFDQLWVLHRFIIIVTN